MAATFGDGSEDLTSRAEVRTVARRHDMSPISVCYGSPDRCLYEQNAWALRFSCRHFFQPPYWTYRVIRLSPASRCAQSHSTVIEGRCICHRKKWQCGLCYCTFLVLQRMGKATERFLSVYFRLHACQYSRNLWRCWPAGWGHIGGSELDRIMLRFKYLTKYR